MYLTRNHSLLFMTGLTTSHDGYQWDYSGSDHEWVAKWDADVWHHIAATWDAGTGSKALYLDGKLVADGKPARFTTNPHWMETSRWCALLCAGH